MKQIGLKIGTEKLRKIERKKRITQSFIFRAVCNFYGLKPDEVLKEKSRKNPEIIIRQLTMYLCSKKIPGLTWKANAAFFGKDHATAYHSRNVIQNLIDTNRDFREENIPIINEIMKL
jgi:chromosomal replication initiation ATPase DnaA